MNLPQHYLLMDQHIKAGMDVPEASLKAFQAVTGKIKRRRMLRPRKKS